MPSRQRIEQLISQVEQGRYVEAIEEFYAEEASMQKNQETPRRGRKILLANERGVLRSFKSVRTLPGTSYLVDDNRAVIHWVFEFTRRDGYRFTQDELAYQYWIGERIVEERFYYDPAQQRLDTFLRIGQSIGKLLFRLGSMRHKRPAPPRPM
jgi:hypothetical protein